MTIQSVTGTNVTQKNMYVNPQSNTVSDGSALRVVDAQEKAPTKVKLGAFLGTLTGVALAMLYTFKKGKNIEGLKEIKGIKDINNYFYNLAHIKYKDNYINTEGKEKPTYAIEKLISVLTLGSVGGGLLGGVITDKKENRKAKYREAVIQVIGNIFTPLLCVDLGIRGFEKFFEPGVTKLMHLGEKTRGIPKFVVSIGCLVGGLFLGNKVGNIINEKAFNIKDNRKIKLADLSPQLDDACVAISLVASSAEKISAPVNRVIPLALMIAGYSTGVIQEKSCNIPPKSPLKTENIPDKQAV